MGSGNRVMRGCIDHAEILEQSDRCQNLWRAVLKQLTEDSLRYLEGSCTSRDVADCIQSYNTLHSDELDIILTLAGIDPDEYKHVLTSKEAHHG